tara:strand:+ start:619 stop:798 length:180 start_codon:yes stop_codon:yes gene_type:complete
MCSQNRLKEDCVGIFGWGGRIRTCECRLQKPMPYRLATPQENDHIQYIHETSQISSNSI